MSAYNASAPVTASTTDPIAMKARPGSARKNFTALYGLIIAVSTAG